VKFIVGIGNPGQKYSRTRHNVGFMAVDAAKKALKVNAKELSLVKPSTFVNNTGEAVKALSERGEFKHQDLLVICDDVNLPFGKMRFRASGSAGGHHGLESVIEALGSKDFPRLRIGVGNESMPKDLAGFVLERFSAQEEKELKAILEKAVLVCDSWVKEGFSAALDRLSQLQSK
jgi:PTH1 family peptidyl-tRNA hydrolase